MKKLLILSGVFCTVAFISCNQNTDDARKKNYDESVAKLDSANKKKFIKPLATDSTGALNYTDAAGKKQGHWIYTGSMRHLPGYSDNAKVEEGLYKNDMKEGEWIEYNADGSVKSKTTFDDNKPVN
jgi:antitoxin component YwqK of YwqJK toxin-antitoxin module